MRYFPSVVVTIFCFLMIFMPLPDLSSGQVTSQFLVIGESEYFVYLEDIQTSSCYKVWQPSDLPLKKGNIVEGSVDLKAQTGRRYDGVFDQHAYLVAEGLKGFGQLSRYDLVMDKHQQGILQLNELRGRVLSLYSAMVLADKDYLSEEDMHTFTVLGLRHILAISGMHLVLLYEMIGKIPLGKKFKWILLFVLMAYLFQIGWPASALRAFLMMSYQEVSRLLKRPFHGRYALACSTLLVILVFPYRLFSIGFQFSTLAIYGIYLFHVGNRKPKWVQTALMLLGINVILLPLQAYYFHQVSALGWLMALLLGWLFNLLIRMFYLFPLGVFMFGSMFVTLVNCLNPLLDMFFEGLKWIANHLSFALIPIVLPSPYLLCCLLLMVIWLPHLNRIYLRVLYGVTIMTINVSIILGMVVEPWTIHLVDVGQGDGIVLLSPHNKAIVVDTGKTGREIEGLLAHHGIEDVELLVVTHQHKDHLGGLERLNESFNVKSLMTNSSYKGDFEYILAQKGYRVSLEGLSAKIVLAEEVGRSENNKSVVMKVCYESHSMLLTGDIEAPVEALMKDIDVDFLKVAHHGSDTSSSLDFLERTSPKYAIISVGENDYGHPSMAVVSRLEKLGVDVKRTDQDGTVVVTWTK